LSEHSSISSEPAPKQKSAPELPRWLGFMGVLLFSLAGLGMSRSGNIILDVVPGRWPGINLVVIVAVALGAGLLITLTFSTIGALIRRPAADYVIASRLIHPSIGFASSWTFAITLAMFAGNVAGSIARQTVPNFMQTLGTVFGIQDVLPLSKTIASGQGTVLIGTVVIIIAFLVMTLPPKVLSWLMRVGLIMVLLSWLILLFQLGTAAEGTFTSRYDQIFGAGTYAQHIELAYQYGLDTDLPNPRTILIVGLLSGFYLFFGATLPTQMAGEVKKPSQSLLPGTVLALILAGGITLLSVFFLQRLVPTQFLSAQSYLTQKQIEVTGLALSWLPFYAAVVRPDMPLVMAVGLSWLYLLFLLVQVLMFVLSRIVLAWSRDQVVPARLGFISPRQKIPLVAVLIAAIGVQIGLIDAAQGGSIFSAMHFAVFLASSQIIPVAALVLYPFLGKKVEGKKHLSIAPSIFIVLAGTATLVYLIWTIAAMFLYPYRLQDIRVSTFTWLAVCFLSGLVWYIVRWNFLRVKGISLPEVFRSMPPED